MAQNQAAVEWLAAHVLRHEPALRRWLARTGVHGGEIDDIVQQTYCKLSELGSVAHITDPRAYFFTAARSILLQRVRRDRVVHIQAMSEQIMDEVADHAPSPESAVGARRELSQVLGVIAALPHRYRQVIELRRMEGLSQKETATKLGITEKSVENSLARGLKAVLKAFEQDDCTYAGLTDEMMERAPNAGRR